VRPATVSITGSGASPVIPLDYIAAPFNVTLACVASGTVNYTVQHTFSDVFAPTYSAATDTWFNHDNAVLVNATSNESDNFFFPVKGVRIQANTGNVGTVTMTALQGLPL
jgi:hypothetical protein